jgi:hypothetical protein
MPPNNGSYPNLLMNLKQDYEFRPIASDYVFQDVGSDDKKIAQGHSPEGKSVSNFRVNVIMETSGQINFHMAFQLGSFVYRTQLCPDLPAAADYIHYLLYVFGIKPEIAIRLARIFTDEFCVPLDPADFPEKQMGITY